MFKETYNSAIIRFEEMITNNQDQKIDNTKLKEKISYIKEVFTRELSILFSNDFSMYTIQYNEYINVLRNQYSSLLSKRTSINSLENDLISIIQKINNDVKISEVMHKISIKEKNLILLGPNGSGKTSLAVFLQKSNQNIRVIPAFKPLYYKKDIVRAPSTTKITDYNNINTNSLYNKAHSGISTSSRLFDDWDTLFTSQIIAIINEHIEKALNFKKTSLNEETYFERIKKLFEEVFSNIIIDIDSSEKIITCVKNQGKIYDLNGLSDGERSALFYIGTIITAPENSYIIIDEPENHLNPAIYNMLWDTLENLRNDCQFIYISHTMDFVNSRKNYEIMTINSFEYPDNFTFEFIDPNLLDFPSELLMSIVGSRRQILFCEGEKDSLDYKIYNALFSDKYLVIPVKSSTDVKKFTRLSKELSKIFFVESLGIIDYDYLPDSEIEKLSHENIKVLKTNEIEMILMDENIIRQLIKNKDSTINPHNLEKKVNDFKNNFLTLITNRRDFIINSYLKKHFDTYTSNNKIIEYEKLDSIKEEIKNYTLKFPINDVISRIDNQLNLVTTDNDYDLGLTICNLKTEVTRGLGNKYIDSDYEQRALEIIRQDRNVKEHIISKYFN